MLEGRLRVPGPRRSDPLIRLVRGLWTLPTNLIGHLAGLVVSGRAPRRVVGPAAMGWLYQIRAGIGLDWVGAVTLGHAILYRPGVIGGEALPARLTLAHELGHTRQHDWLGPFYLPLHVVAQLASALVTGARRPIVSRVHDANPLEQTFICVPASAVRQLAPTAETEELLRAFGV